MSNKSTYKKIYAQCLRSDNDNGKYESEKHGLLLAPKSFNELIAVLQLFTYDPLMIHGWRGQADISWDIDSALLRRIKKYKEIEFNKIDAELLMWATEEKLLNEARIRGHAYHNGVELDDLELMALLQHMGAATRLIDFSKNVLIALWMLSNDVNLMGSYGLLVGLNISMIYSSDIYTLPNKNKIPFKILIREFQDKLLIYKPNHLIQRIKSQHGFFITGVTRKNLLGYTPFRSEDDLVLFAISPELKQEIVQILTRVFNYTDLFIYDDLAGFSKANSSVSEFDENMFPLF